MNNTLDNTKKNNKWSLVLVITVLMALLITNLVKVSQLKKQISYMEESFSSEINLLLNNINKLENTIENANSLINDCKYVVSNFDKDNNTIDLTFRLTPKNNNENNRFSLTMGDNVVDFVPDSSDYTATVTVDIFGCKYYEPILTLTSGFSQRTEELPPIDTRYMWHEILPSVDISVLKDNTYESNKFRMKTTLALYTYSTDYAQFKDGKVVVTINNEEKKVVDLALEGGSFPSEVTLKDSFSMNITDRITIKLIANDNAGYTHVYTLYDWCNNSIDQPILSEAIYNSEGTLLTPQEKL